MRYPFFWSKWITCVFLEEGGGDVWGGRMASRGIGVELVRDTHWMHSDRKTDLSLHAKTSCALRSLAFVYPSTSSRITVVPGLHHLFHLNRGEKMSQQANFQFHSGSPHSSEVKILILIYLQTHHEHHFC